MMRQILGIALLLACLHPARAAHTTARLVLSHDTVKPGESFWAGIELRMDDGWHTYWRNSGESGKPTTITWKLPASLTHGEIAWPIPEKLTEGGVTTYVFHKNALLLVPITVGPNASAGIVDVGAAVRWLECEKICVEGRTQLTAQVTIGSQSKLSADNTKIEEAHQKMPPSKPDGFASAWWEGPPSTNDKRAVIFEWSPQTIGAKGDFFSFPSSGFNVLPPSKTVGGVAGKVRLRQFVELMSGEWPKTLRGLFVEQVAGKTSAAFEAEAAVADAAPSTAAAPSTQGAAAASASTDTIATNDVSTQPSADSTPAPERGFKVLLANLGFAFLGGLILNLMPCVLPVIALKILGFVNQSGQSPGQVRKLGLVYGAGVVTSFLALAALVVGGKLVSWGAQFGDPRFLIVITVLVCFIALNLFGLFEITLGGRTMEAAADVAGREGYSGAFFNGVLATVLGTSCSAPFLAGAVGYAYFQPPVVVVLIFTFVGLGLAAPYVILSFQPGWLRYLPKPGVWMERFKVAMGFPMLATAAWLLSLIARHHGTRGVLWIGFFLVALALSAWIFGEFYQRGRSHRHFALILSALVLLLGYGWILEGELNWRTKPKPLSENLVATDPDGIAWKPWSHDAVKQAREAGKPVFVDFTADWCVNCQLNKKTSIEIDSVRNKVKELGVEMLIADYTQSDDHPEITEELARFQRSAVPLVLVYPKDLSKPPIVLPPALTPSIVLDALDKASK